MKTADPELNAFLDLAVSYYLARSGTMRVRGPVAA